MNWDAIAAVGEVLGAVAVVVSVCYLAIQVRKQTQESKLTATRELAERYQTNFDILVQDKELSALWGKAVQNYQDLPDDERLRAALWMQRITRVWEAIHLHIAKENVDSGYFSSVILGYTEGATFPGYQQWWESSRNLFDGEFRAYVDEIMEEAKERGYTSSFNKAGENAA